jgi:galactose-1-phosphate uridylyltransferase
LNLSQNLLCSCNLYHHPDIRFKSFGDAAGDRNDVYRLLRQVNVTISKIKSKSKDIYNKLNQQYNNDIISRASKVIEALLNDTPHNDVDSYKLLESLEYVENNKVIVPVFDKQHKEMFNNLSSYVLELISIEAKRCFDDIESLDLMAVKHQINRYEIANELWHQIFGTLNEMLVEYSLIKVPPYHKDEGRYLKAIYTKEYYD